MSRQKEIKKLIRDVERADWTVVQTTRGYQLRSPDGATVVHAHLTNSDWRSIKNLTAILKRHGIKLS